MRILLNKKKFGKIFVCVTLTLSFALSAGAVMPVQTASAASTSQSSKADKIIATGKKYLGVKYKFGAKSGSTKAFDCSSFTQYVYGKHGINLPRTSKQQSKVGVAVSKKNMKKGDLLFFYSPVHHVGIYMGNGKILHTYGKGGVRIDNLSKWESRLTKVRRVIK
ncbi:C40 family peptidase [Paenibacillus sp. E194]|uniref:C40 family peptidase n=1 Tax=Paenibacillus sp. E194 TaxID=1458845 RepID=UPI0005C9EF5C